MFQKERKKKSSKITFLFGGKPKNAHKNKVVLLFSAPQQHYSVIYGSGQKRETAPLPTVVKQRTSVKHVLLRSSPAFPGVIRDLVCPTCGFLWVSPSQMKERFATWLLGEVSAVAVLISRCSASMFLMKTSTTYRLLTNLMDSFRL